MQSVSYCLCPGTKLITNKTLHQSVLMTGICTAPCNDEYKKNKKKGSRQQLWVICFPVKWILMVDRQSTSQCQQVAYKITSEIKIFELK